MSTEEYYKQVFKSQQDNRFKMAGLGVNERLKRLRTLERAIKEKRAEIRKALYDDFCKPAMETDITEIFPVLSEIRHARSNLRNWMRPDHSENTIPFLFTNNRVERVSKGTCLIISPWNYPFQLAMGPLVSAIAGGNTVVIKPSEITKHTSALIYKIIHEHFPSDEISVIEGGRECAEALLKLPFDNICFTGSATVGKRVMKAAAENLASVTLELGGKSGVYIHHDCNIKDAVSKISAAKLVNAGQSCVAPDYILAHNDIKEKLVELLKLEFLKYFDRNNPGERTNYASIISEDQMERLHRLGGSIAWMNKEKRLLEPVVLTETLQGDKSINEEIFGPVIPVTGVSNESEALKIMHKHSSPLSIYIFTHDKTIKKLFTAHTTSGSICFNDCAVQFLHPGLPFGGKGYSGTGRLHGKSGFLSFTDERVIFEQRTGFTMAKLLYPPYNKFKKRIVDLLVNHL
jgi:aldehyde dehydrogenase (NAD+)